MSAYAINFLKITILVFTCTDGSREGILVMLGTFEGDVLGFLDLLG